MADGVKVLAYISQVIEMNATKEKKSYRFLKSAIKSAEIKFDVITPGKVQKILDKAGDDFDKFKKQKIIAWRCIAKSAKLNSIPKNVLSAELTCRSLKARKLQIQEEEILTKEEIDDLINQEVMNQIS